MLDFFLINNFTFLKRRDLRHRYFLRLNYKLTKFKITLYWNKVFFFYNFELMGILFKPITCATPSNRVYDNMSRPWNKKKSGVASHRLHKTSMASKTVGLALSGRCHSLGLDVRRLHARQLGSARSKITRLPRCRTMLPETLCVVLKLEWWCNVSLWGSKLKVSRII